MAKIELKNLTKSYGAVQVIKGIDLTIEKGEFMVFVGPSGCGKSTLLRLISGLEEITTGDMIFDGERVNNLIPSRRGIAMVFQSYALYPQMTVRGNLSFGLKNARMPKDEIDKRIARAAEILQIQPLLDRKPGALSGGQRQRVAIGRALVRDVDVFLFDEPLSNLDAKLRSELRVEIKRLHSRLNNTMVYVTHDQIEALTLADRIAVMKGGVIQQLADPQSIYNKPSNLFVAGFIGSPSMNFLQGSTVDGGKTFVFGDHRINLAGYDGGAVLERDQAVLGVRPEHITVLHEAPVGPSIPAVVEIDEHLGADGLLWLKAGTKDICVRVPVEGRLPSGTRVHLALDIAKASLFDAKSEQRI